MATSQFNAAAQARRVSETAARRSGVLLGEVDDVTEVREVVGLFEDVWGRNADGVPFPAEVLVSISHSGGAVTSARDATSGALLGAAVLGVAPSDETYSYIAAVAPGTADRGIGFAVKLRQRAWALERGLPTMRWTFDPLVSRNARFNLVKLGARTSVYLPSFYGRMDDLLNGGDSDRLVATWQLDAPAAVAATEGTASEPVGPAVDAEVVANGPDGLPAHCREGGLEWVRAPRDIVALRRSDPPLAAAWRGSVRTAFTSAFAQGHHADAVTHDGWYRLTKEDQQ